MYFNLLIFLKFLAILFFCWLSNRVFCSVVSICYRSLLFSSWQVFHISYNSSLSDVNFLQVSRTLLSILVNNFRWVVRWNDKIRQKTSSYLLVIKSSFFLGGGVVFQNPNKFYGFYFSKQVSFFYAYTICKNGKNLISGTILWELPFPSSRANVLYSFCASLLYFLLCN